jgi:acyl-CoA reductase-like NAD-dependent aldehyde dehydrogenase
MAYRSINPNDGKLIKTFPELTDAQLEKAMATAAACFETWRKKSYAERAVVVAKAAALMHARVDEFARPVTLEMGKLFEQAQGEVVLSADIIAYYAKRRAVPRAVCLTRARAKPSSKAVRLACSLASSRGTFPITSSRALPPPT